MRKLIDAQEAYELRHRWTWTRIADHFGVTVSGAQHAVYRLCHRRGWDVPSPPSTAKRGAPMKGLTNAEARRRLAAMGVPR